MSIHLESVKRLLHLKGNSLYSLISTTTTCASNDPDDIITSTTETVINNAYSGTFSKSEIDGELVLKSDIKLYVNPEGLTITTSDQIKNGTDTYSIKDIKPIYDQETIALYILQIRK